MSDERSDWAREILTESDVEELQFRTDRFIQFEKPAVSMSVELSMNEAIRLCNLWDSALDGDYDSKRQFIDALNGAIAFIDSELDKLGIDYAEEYIDWDDEDDTEV